MSEQDARARAIAEQVAAGCLIWDKRDFDFDKAATIIAAALSATADTARAQGAQCSICESDGVADSKATICEWHYGRAVQGEAAAESVVADARAQAFEEAANLVLGVNPPTNLNAAFAAVIRQRAAGERFVINLRARATAGDTQSL